MRMNVLTFTLMKSLTVDSESKKLLERVLIDSRKSVNKLVYTHLTLSVFMDPVITIPMANVI